MDGLKVVWDFVIWFYCVFGKNFINFKSGVFVLLKDLSV